MGPSREGGGVGGEVGEEGQRGREREAEIEPEIESMRFPQNNDIFQKEYEVPYSGLLCS